MKRPAFMLVVCVVMFQLLLAAGSLAACFVTESDKCTGDKVAGILDTIIIQTFALYAAESVRR